MGPINEQDELLLNRLLDDDLSAPEAVSIQKRMTREPALRETMDSLTRIDALLSQRGADQPDVDWYQFRQDILHEVGEIEQQAKRPIPFRLARKIWLGVPLAAAAAIALLLVTLYYPSPHMQPGSPMATDTKQKITTPTAPKPDEGTMLVRFNRPDFAKPNPTIQVSYTQSSDLAQSMQQRDRGYRSRPQGHMYLAARSQTPSFSQEPPPPL